MDLYLAGSREQVAECFDIMKQLRPHLSENEFVERVQVQKKHGYQLLIARRDDKIIGVAGFVIGQKLAWGKHLYIDDLVTDESRRSAGAGKAMLAWLEEHGKEQQCEQMHLDSGVQRFAAHKFYLRENYTLSPVITFLKCSDHIAMAKLLLPLKHYDEAGRVIPSVALWLCLLRSLRRSYIVFIGALTIPKASEVLLNLFYPSKQDLYLGFMTGIGAVLIAAVCSFRDKIREAGFQWMVCRI